jgi:hypothetical protein
VTRRRIARAADGRPVEGTLPIPADVVNEQALITAALLEPQARARLANLEPELFNGDRHAAIWAELRRLHELGIEPDVDMLRRNLGDDIAGYCERLTSDRRGPPANLRHHVELLRWDAARVEAARGPLPLLLKAFQDPTKPAESVRSLAVAFADTLKGYGGSRAFKGISAAEIAEPLADTNYLCHRFHLASGRPNLLAGYGGIGKTMLAQHAALVVAAGLKEIWGGVPVERSGRVLHLDFEQGSHLTRLRYQKLARALGVNLAALGNALEVAILPRTRLSTAEAEGLLAEACDGRALCIVDNLRAAVDTKGGGENESEFRAVLDKLTRVSEQTGCCFLILAHEGKPSESNRGRAAIHRVRGTSAITDAAGCVLSITSRDGVLKIEHAKSSYGATQEPWHFRLVDVEHDALGRATSVEIREVDPASALTAYIENGPIKAAKESIRKVLASQGEMPKSAVIMAATGKNEILRAALDATVEDGEVIVRPGKRGALLCSLATASLSPASKKAEAERTRANNPVNDTVQTTPIEDRISVAPMHRVPLYARPKGKPGELPVPATTLLEDPYGELELSHGAVRVCSLVRNAVGELVLNVAVAGGSLMGAEIVPLYARPKGKFGQEENLVPATTLVEDPFGELELSNEVVLVFSLARNPAGELALNVEPRRRGASPGP